MEEQEFINTIKRVGEKRVSKISNSYGVYDAFKYYRKHKPNDKKYVLTESQYFAIIRNINKRLRDYFILGYDIEFPCKMGMIEARKTKAAISFEGKKIKTNLPIDWERTLKLWYEDESSRKAKTLVYQNVPEIFRIKYNLRNANYNNKSFYLFSPNRELKLMVKQAIKNKTFDAFKSY